jgi:hypothetical protein
MTSGPENALELLAGRVAEEGDPLAPAAVHTGLPAPVLGPFVASGPHAAADPGAYSFVVEAVREGYECHFSRPRILEPGDPDLLLLAGDLFYAYGISTLARLGDTRAVGILSDLIRFSGELHAAGRAGDTGSLWLAHLHALGWGTDAALPPLVAALRRGEVDARERLDAWSEAASRRAGAEGRIGEVREVLHFASAGLDFP